uniref:Toll-like receptor n=1 Tax=Anadara kagoshimensis TaxID=1390362 RepID=A0A7H0S6E6_9BIVA|nr:toll-like receptor [Anadara sativa]
MKHTRNVLMLFAVILISLAEPSTSFSTTSMQTDLTSNQAIVDTYSVVPRDSLLEENSSPKNIGNQGTGSLDVLCLTQYCYCKEYTVRCSGHHANLTYIPKVPNNTKNLYFSRNELPIVTKETFRNISNSNLKVLSLTKNDIREISKDAFKDFKSLQILYLDGNKNLPLDELSEAFGSFPRNACPDIFMEDMNLEVLPGFMFKGLQFCNISIISLRQNNIQRIDGKMFSNLTVLNELDVSTNFIYSINLRGLQKLEHLNLNRNSLFRTPQFYSLKTKECLLPNLKTLCLEENQIQIITKYSFSCLPKLQHIFLNSNPIIKIGGNIISSLESINILQLDDIGIDHELFEMEPNPFNSSTLSVLKFSLRDVSYSFYNVSEIFQLMPQLRELHYSGYHLPVKPKILHSIFPIFPRLEVLSFNYLGLREIPAKLFSKFPQLKELSLQGNEIYSWIGDEVFGNVSSILTLDMSYNNIAVINQTSFPQEMLKSLKNIDLSGNRLSCTCDNLWFKNWIRESKNYKQITLKTYPDGYPCQFPPDLKEKNISFQDFNPTTESCREKEDTRITVASVTFSVIIFMILVTSVFVYQCRWHIRYFIFTFKRKTNPEYISEDKFTYDGFVIYSDNDRNWVHNTLINVLEAKEDFSLCIRLRDFEVGKVFVDNIVENMYLSKKIIVVLSNNFVKSEWCRFQLMLAQSRLVKESADSLVLIMLEEVDSNHMITSVHSLITIASYISWTEENTSQKYFWEQVIHLMRRKMIQEVPV